MIFVTTYKNYEKVHNEFTDVVFLNFADTIPSEVDKKDSKYMDWGIFAPRKSLIKSLKENQITLTDFYMTYNRDLKKLWPSTNFMLPNLLNQFSGDIIIFCDSDLDKMPNFLVKFFEVKGFKIRKLYAI